MPTRRSGTGPSEIDREKQDHRRHALARRKARPTAEIAAARAAVSAHLLGWLERDAPPVTTVAAYCPLPTEPLADDVPDLLVAAGLRVLLPIAAQDAPLDWAEYPCPLRAGRFRIPEPAGPALGADAIGAADLVLVPALLVDRRGVRLGRGGGHYDRTLPAAGGLVVAVVFDDEIVETLPSAPTDKRVDAVLTPSAVRRIELPLDE